MKNSIIALVFLLLACPFSVSSQDQSTNELHYEVNRVYPSISFTREELNEARTIVDLNPYYKPSWIRKYVSVEILTSDKGKTKKAVSKSDVLSPEQKNLIKMADTGTDISVLVKYIPENTLPNNEIHEIPFSFTVDPESEANYVGGDRELNEYLKKKAIDRVPNGSFVGYSLAAIKFTVDEVGRIIDAHVFWSSEDEEIDALLLETICTMPDWKPAAYADGTKVKQEFVLTVGSMENCAIPLLNIRRGVLARND